MMQRVEMNGNEYGYRSCSSILLTGFSFLIRTCVNLGFRREHTAGFILIWCFFFLIYWYSKDFTVTVTHLPSHQHTHIHTPVLPVCLALPHLAHVPGDQTANHLV